MKKTHKARSIGSWFRTQDAKDKPAMAAPVAATKKPRRRISSQEAESLLARTATNRMTGSEWARVMLILDGV